MQMRKTYTHVFSGLSRKASRACRRPRLLMYWISPFWKLRAKENFSAVNCKVSRASAWASVIAGMWGVRFCSPYPVSNRRVYWMIMCPSSQYRRGLNVYPGFPPKLRKVVKCIVIIATKAIERTCQVARARRVPESSPGVWRLSRCRRVDHCKAVRFHLPLM